MNFKKVTEQDTFNLLNTYLAVHVLSFGPKIAR